MFSEYSRELITVTFQQYTSGPNCDQCKANTFYLSSKNQFGCIACFCMGITQQCSSSNWYRDEVRWTIKRL